MLTFWLIAAVLILVSVGVVAIPLLRKAPSKVESSGDQTNVLVFQDHLAELEAAATRHVVVDTGAEVPHHQTTFSLRQVEEFHELYHLAEAAIGVDNIDLLLNGKAVPLTRELWLPLLWSLRK